MLQLTGCTSLKYYGQVIKGQAEILSKRQPIADLLKNPETSEELKQKLLRVQKIRNFASQQMKLPGNGSFSSYADLQRKYVVWNVFATPKFSLDPVRWCFPVAGCLAYRGYFSEHAAEQFAKDLREQENDVYVAGIPAYSTLGWFSDPLLSTVIDWPEARLAGLVFHELAHELVYIKGDTEFNESFAAMIEMEGVRRWFVANARKHKNKNYLQDYLQSYLQDKARQHDFVRLVMRYQDKLKVLYSTDWKEEAMFEGKQEIFNDMRKDYQQLKLKWSGYSGYDAWMSGEINNAKIASVAMYQKYVPAFQALLKQHQGRLQDFYQGVRRISVMDVEKRRKYMSEIALILH
jgi:predicted aminopeptidase